MVEQYRMKSHNFPVIFSIQGLSLNWFESRVIYTGQVFIINYTVKAAWMLTPTHKDESTSENQKNISKVT